MKIKSISMGIFFTSFLLFSTVIANLSANYDYKILSVFGMSLSILYFIFFYTLGGIYHATYLLRYNPPIIMGRIEEWILTPLFYGVLAYLIDRFVLTRFVGKTWLRVLLLLVIFAAMSIPVLIWHPPLADH